MTVKKAFAPESVLAGAVISYSGDKLIVEGEGIVSAIESRLTDPTVALDHLDQWLTNNVPLLSRSAAWIVPLSWHPLQSTDAAEARKLRDRSNELWISIRGACTYRQGDLIGIDLVPSTDPGERYISELVRTGVRRADWWAFGDSAVVLVVHGEPLPAPKTAIAVHVVPIGWIPTRRPAKKIPPLDLSWSWTDVVEFVLREASRPPGNLTGADEEGQSA